MKCDTILTEKGDKRMDKKLQRWIIFLQKTQWIWAFILLPLINIAAFIWADPLQENISHIANVMRHQSYVILWASSCAFYLFVYTALFCIRVQYTKKTGWAILLLSCLLMVISVLIPYRPDMHPFLAKLHIDMAMLATILYVVSALFILTYTYFYDSSLLSCLLPWYVLIVGGCSFLFLLMGNVSTLTETLFVIGMGIFWFYALKKTASAV